MIQLPLRKKLGSFLDGVSDAVKAAASFLTKKVYQCRVLENQELILASHEEIIRLLLTPQGRRSSELCPEGECSFPTKP